jgi:cytochrome P450
VLVIVHVARSRIHEFNALSNIPGPAPNFFWGNYRQLVKNGWGQRHVTLLELHKDFGPVVRLHMPLFKKPFVITNFISEESRNNKFDALRPSRTMCPFSLMGLPMGELHSKHRAALLLLNSNNLNRPEYADAIVSATEDLLAKWERMIGDKHALDNHRSATSNDIIVDDLIQWALIATCEALFGVKIKDSKEKRLILEAVEAFVQEISHRTWEPLYLWFTESKRRENYLKGHAYLRKISRQLYHEAKLQSERSPMINAMITLSNERGDDEWVIDEMVLQLAASFQSTGDTLANCLWELALNPEIQKDLYEKVSAIAEKQADLLNIKKVPLACNVWYETLRIHPAVPFSARKITSPVELGDYQVSIPFHLLYFKFAVGSNPDIFENPSVFNPYRFDDMKTRIEKLSNFLPFGTGKRSCMGQQLAEFMSLYALKRLVMNFEFYHDSAFRNAHTSMPPSEASVSVKPTDMNSLVWRERKNRKFTI